MNYPKELQDFIENLPSSSVNNSRAYWRRAYEKAQKEKYGGYYTNLLYEIVGLDGDRTPYDAGMELSATNFD
jgi:hypothetical protein